MTSLWISFVDQDDLTTQFSFRELPGVRKLRILNCDSEIIARLCKCCRNTEELEIEQTGFAGNSDDDLRSALISVPMLKRLSVVGGSLDGSFLSALAGSSSLHSLEYYVGDSWKSISIENLLSCPNLSSIELIGHDQTLDIDSFCKLPRDIKLRLSYFAISDDEKRLLKNRFKRLQID